MSATMRAGHRRPAAARRAIGASLLAVLATAGTGIPTGPADAAQAPRGEQRAPEGVEIPPGYVIGTDDVLSVVFWREAEMSAEAVVRPDGMISLPLLNDVTAAGLTPEALRLVLTERAAQFIEDPTVTVVVRAINSRKVFITGQVARPAAYPLSGPMTVVQLITTAGGLQDWAKTRDIIILRQENGKPVTLPFDYREILRGRKLDLNIELKPGDTVIVP